MVWAEEWVRALWVQTARVLHGAAISCKQVRGRDLVHACAETEHVDITKAHTICENFQTLTEPARVGQKV